MLPRRGKSHSGGTSLRQVALAGLGVAQSLLGLSGICQGALDIAVTTVREVEVGVHAQRR